MSFAVALSPVVQPVAKYRRETSTASQILQSVVTELLRDTFNLCSRHLALRYLQSVFSTSCFYKPQSVFSAPCSQIPSICVFNILFLQTLVCVLGTLLSDTFNLCFQHLVFTNLSLCSRHLALRYLQSVFSTSCFYIPSVLSLGTVYWHMFCTCYQQQLLRNFQCVFSVTCSHKSLSMSSRLPLLTHFQSVLTPYCGIHYSLTMPVPLRIHLIWRTACQIALVSDVWNASVSTYIAV
jgi:hypothetical protein